MSLKAILKSTASMDPQTLSAAMKPAADAGAFRLMGVSSFADFQKKRAEFLASRAVPEAKAKALEVARPLVDEILRGLNEESWPEAAEGKVGLRVDLNYHPASDFDGETPVWESAIETTSGYKPRVAKAKNGNGRGRGAWELNCWRVMNPDVGYSVATVLVNMALNAGIDTSELSSLTPRADEAREVLGEKVLAAYNTESLKEPDLKRAYAAMQALKVRFGPGGKVEAPEVEVAEAPEVEVAEAPAEPGVEEPNLSNLLEILDS